MAEPKIKEFELHRPVTEIEYSDRVLIVMRGEDPRPSFIVAGYRRTGNYEIGVGKEAVMVEIISDPVEQKTIRDELLKDSIPREAMAERASKRYPNLAERERVLEEEIERYKKKHVVFFY